MLRTAGLLLTIVSMFAPRAQAQPSAHPSTVAPDGAAPILKAAEATRGHLLGVVDLYSVAIYAEGPVRDRARLVSTNAAKAVRIAVLYDDDLKRRLTLDWRRELLPPLEMAAMAQLRGAFAGLKRGDAVVVEYSPGKGTAIRINKSVVVSEAHHDVMLAFLDHWIGQRPVSEELKRALEA
jgi:hypothetical protein